MNFKRGGGLKQDISAILDLVLLALIMLQKRDLSFTKKREKAVRGFRAGEDWQVGERTDTTLPPRSPLADLNDMQKIMNGHKRGGR